MRDENGRSLWRMICLWLRRWIFGSASAEEYIAGRNHPARAIGTARENLAREATQDNFSAKWGDIISEKGAFVAARQGFYGHP